MVRPRPLLRLEGLLVGAGATAAYLLLGNPILLFVGVDRLFGFGLKYADAASTNLHGCTDRTSVPDDRMISRQGISLRRSNTPIDVASCRLRGTSFTVIGP